jgi:hypothetical protein
MAVTFQCKIALCPESMFCFGTISSVADEEGILHHIVDLSEKKLSPKISEKARMRTEQSPLPRAKTTFCKSGAGNSFTRRTPLSTSSTEEWTWITRKKETNGTEARQATLPAPSPSKMDRKKFVTVATPFYPDVLFIGGEWNRLPSPTTSQPCLGNNLLSEKLADGGTIAGIFSDITKPENGIRHSLYPEMKSQK